MPPRRMDTASRIVHAPPRVIYQALLDPDAVVRWRPPAGMTARIHAFDAREGGSFRVAFIYSGDDHAVQGKTTRDADIFEGQFQELVPDQRVVEIIEFLSNDPAFSGKMTVTTSLRPVPGGTEVTISCENVPEGIRVEDHQAGMASTLGNLAAYTEKPAS